MKLTVILQPGTLVGRWKGMKWLFYIYYPLHLVLVGILRIVLWGNDVNIMIGGR